MIPQLEFEFSVWGADTRLLRMIDPRGCQPLIFPLLFYNRVCNKYDEELGAAPSGFVMASSIAPKPLTWLSAITP